MYELALFGSMGRIQEHLRHLEEQDSRYAPFVSKVRTLARDFEDERILALLEQLLHIE